MKVKTYKKIKSVSALLLVLVIGCSFYIERAPIAFLGIGLYLILISLLKTRVKGILVDERQEKVMGSASQVSFQILLPILLLSSIALISGGGNQEFYYIKAIGTILSYVTSLGLVIYILAYLYYDKKTGGNE